MVMPEVVVEELPDAVPAADDDIASVHTTGVHCAVDASSVTAEVLALGSLTMNSETASEPSTVSTPVDNAADLL